MAQPKIAKPFVKWAGGKTQLLSEIEKNLPPDFESKDITYVEPFVGGGAVLFHLLSRYPNIRRAIINDINGKLINVYSVIKKRPDELVKALMLLEEQYRSKVSDGRKDFFLQQRSRFNEEKLDDVEQAALFIFLNRTCFNGLYRENSKGKFNVPHGKYSNPTICDEENIFAVSELLKKVEICCGDFSELEQFSDKNSFFYFDPPYKPLNETSSFNSYVKEAFDDAEQVRLRDFCDVISGKGSSFLLSNSDVKGANPDNNFFDDLYATYEIKRVFANRMVNSNASKRGKLTELMISNANKFENKGGL